MSIRKSWFAAAAVVGGALVATPASAQQELVYGSWTPPREYQNAHVMPEINKNIEKETNGQIKWKLVPGGAIANAKSLFSAVKDGLMQAGGPGIPQYVPSTLPTLYTIYATVVTGHNDPVAATGAALEVMYLRCPDCLEDFRKINAVPLGGWTSSAYLLACKVPVKSPADLEGKRVRGTGGNADLIRAAGGVAVGATLVEAVSLLQRGGLDCQHGIADWLRTFGYAEYAKHVLNYPLGLSGPAIGYVLNRDTWNSFTPEQKQLHIRQAAWMSAKQAIGNFLIANDAALKSVVDKQGVSVITPDEKAAKAWDEVIAKFEKTNRANTIAAAKELGVADPGALIDDYKKTVEKWRPRSKEIGRDIDKFTEVLMTEVFSKIDLEKL